MPFRRAHWSPWFVVLLSACAPSNDGSSVGRHTESIEPCIDDLWGPSSLPVEIETKQLIEKADRFAERARRRYETWLGTRPVDSTTPCAQHFGFLGKPSGPPVATFLPNRESGNYTMTTRLCCYGNTCDLRPLVALIPPEAVPPSGGGVGLDHLEVKLEVDVTTEILEGIDHPADPLDPVWAPIRLEGPPRSDRPVVELDVLKLASVSLPYAALTDPQTGERIPFTLRFTPRPIPLPKALPLTGLAGRPLGLHPGTRATIGVGPRFYETRVDATPPNRPGHVAVAEGFSAVANREPGDAWHDPSSVEGTRAALLYIAMPLGETR